MLKLFFPNGNKKENIKTFCHFIKKNDLVKMYVLLLLRLN